MTEKEIFDWLMEPIEELEGQKQALVEVMRALLRVLVHNDLIDPAEMTNWLDERAVRAQNDRAHEALNGWITWLDNHCEVPEDDQEPDTPQI